MIIFSANCELVVASDFLFALIRLGVFGRLECRTMRESHGGRFTKVIGVLEASFAKDRV